MELRAVPDMTMYLALRLGRLLVRLFPYARLYALAGLIGDVQFHLARGRRRVVVDNVRQVLGPDSTDACLRALARQVFRHAARNYLDVLTLGTQAAESLSQRIEMEGIPLLDEALAGGRGVILVAPHMGNMDVLVQYLAFRQVPVTIPVERMTSERLFRFLTNLREAHGVRLLPLGGEIMPELLACLRRGEVVGLVADRNIAGTGIAVPFFGRPALLPSGPGLLALRSSAPLMGVYAERLPGGRVRGHIMRLVTVRRQGRLPESLRAAVAAMASLLEEPIRRHPEQWTIFSPVWTDAAAEGTSPGAAGERPVPDPVLESEDAGRGPRDAAVGVRA